MIIEACEVAILPSQASKHDLSQSLTSFSSQVARLGK